ncbi:PTS transporter subunit EIIC [uncultured Olegusella sp.]|uniref:PTS transporter subunit EIIC n=1 Tax=uncultured Olegusella sp. TaxID=1979846 RepID=UPI00262A90E8|nr:PTS transporter subunit EIIC [uncultured Olegusella sp.]
MASKKELAKQILQHVGGASNIKTATHCITRLRLGLVDDQKADLTTLQNLEGTLGAQIKDGQWQIIIGPGVGSLYEEFEPLLGKDKMAGEVAADIDQEELQGLGLSGVFDTISGIFSPIIPALVAGGIVKGVLALIAYFGIDTGSGNWAIFNMISDIPFYFLPFLLASSAAEKFHVNRSLALIVAGSLMYPTIINAVGTDETPLTLFGMAVPIFNYADSVFPIIFGVFGLSVVYHFIDKFIPDLLKLVVVPALSLGIIIPLNLFALAPIGAWCGIGLANGIVWLFSTLGPIAGFLLGFFMPIIVLFGMHQSTSPIQIANIASLGYDYLLPVSFCHNLAESGAAFGAALRMTNKKMRSVAMTCAFSAFMGISEPALFSIQVPNKTPLFAAMIGNGMSGALTVLLGVKCFGFVMPGITSLPVYMDPSGNPTNLIMIFICIVASWFISCVVSFVLWGHFNIETKSAKQ